MVTITAFRVPKLPMKRKSDKVRLQAAANLEDTSKGLVLSSQPAERIRPSHGGLVQYYSPDEVGRSGSTSSASSVSDLSTTASPSNSACSQCRHCQQQIGKAHKASTKNASFSWKSGWHPARKDEDHEDWRGGWPGSEHISEWRAHMRPTEGVVSPSASSTSDCATSAKGIVPSYFVGCQQLMPESPASFYPTNWDRLSRNTEPPPYEPNLGYELE